ncbi:MAG: tRNA pseudouridine(38-40) synthase TruA [Pseudomonadota bacterium]
MPRYRLTIEYDGAVFVGWQAQTNGRGVQDALADAIETFSGTRYIPRGAGRTDAGVHATGQVAHIDLERDWPEQTIQDALNALIKDEPVAVLSVDAVPDSFDARFSATARHYRYDIVNRRPPAALDRVRAWWVKTDLDIEAMNQAARAVLIGHHDFTTFRASQCQAKSPMKTLDQLCIARDGERVTVFASARSFLHSQVRSMVGSLKVVGEGRWTADDLAAARDARDRKRCGPVAPACGLYLIRVDYGVDDVSRAGDPSEAEEPA